MVTMDVKSKKAAVAKPKKSSPAHPTYLEMIGEAIGSLKERTGSSQIAITKFIESKHKEYQLPPNFKKLLFVQLKKLTVSGRLTKMKNSYKLTAPAKSSKPATAVTKPKAKVAAKPKAKVGAKPKAKVAAKPKVKSLAKKAVKASLAKKRSVTAALPEKRSAPAKKVAAAIKSKVKSVKKTVKSPAKKAAVKKGKK